MPVSGRCGPGRGAWTPFAEFSPEWQALQAARRIQAQTYFIDLPCWAQSEEEDDSPDTQDESQTLLLRATRMDNSDTLWDHLFEDESQQTALPSTLAHYFAQLRGDSPGDALNRQREAFMARWITWAMQQNNGDVLVVCGGWHAPALANVAQMPAGNEQARIVLAGRWRYRLLSHTLQ